MGYLDEIEGVIDALQDGRSIVGDPVDPSLGDVYRMADDAILVTDDDLMGTFEDPEDASRFVRLIDMARDMLHKLRELGVE